MKNTHTPWYKTTLTLAVLPTALLVLGIIAAMGSRGYALVLMTLPFSMLLIGYGTFQMKRKSTAQPGETLIAGGTIFFISTLIASAIIGIAGGTPFGFFIALSVFSGFLVLIGYLQKIASKK